MPEITMHLLTEDEKATIDDAPDKTLQFLYASIMEQGIPAFFEITVMDKAGEIKRRVLYEGDKVLAALDYVDYLVANKIRKDPHE